MKARLTDGVLIYEYKYTNTYNTYILYIVQKIEEIDLPFLCTQEYFTQQKSATKMIVSKNLN